MDGQHLPATVGRVEDDDSWLTAVVRPMGDLSRERARRLGSVLDGLAEDASVVVLDLGASRLTGQRAADVIARASQRLEARGGYLLCVNVDPSDRARLDGAGGDVIALDPASSQPAPPLALTARSRGA